MSILVEEIYELLEMICANYDDVIMPATIFQIQSALQKAKI